MSATAFTEVDVLKATKEWFADPEHYRNDSYHSDGDERGVALASDTYLDKVGSTCAIGGIEHAVYLLAKNGDGKSIGRRIQNWRAKVGWFSGTPDVPTTEPPYIEAYASAMTRCNRVAVRLFGSQPVFFDRDVTSFEDVTFISEWSPKEQLAAVRKVLATAIREAQRDARKKVPA